MDQCVRNRNAPARILKLITDGEIEVSEFLASYLRNGDAVCSRQVEEVLKRVDLRGVYLPALVRGSPTLIGSWRRVLSVWAFLGWDWTLRYRAPSEETPKEEEEEESNHEAPTRDDAPAKERYLEELRGLPPGDKQARLRLSWEFCQSSGRVSKRLGFEDYADLWKLLSSVLTYESHELFALLVGAGAPLRMLGEDGQNLIAQTRDRFSAALLLELRPEQEFELDVDGRNVLQRIFYMRIQLRPACSRNNMAFLIRRFVDRGFSLSEPLANDGPRRFLPLRLLPLEVVELLEHGAPLDLDLFNDVVAHFAYLDSPFLLRWGSAAGGTSDLPGFDTMVGFCVREPGAVWAELLRWGCAINPLHAVQEVLDDEDKLGRALPAVFRRVVWGRTGAEPETKEEKAENEGEEEEGSEHLKEGEPADKTTREEQGKSGEERLLERSLAESVELIKYLNQKHLDNRLADPEEDPENDEFPQLGWLALCMRLLARFDCGHWPELLARLRAAEGLVPTALEALERKLAEKGIVPNSEYA